MNFCFARHLLVRVAEGLVRVGVLPRHRHRARQRRVGVAAAAGVGGGRGAPRLDVGLDVDGGCEVIFTPLCILDG